MKKIKLGIILLTIMFLTTSVQNMVFAWSAPGVSKAVCGYCEKENGHETWCPSYRKETVSNDYDFSNYDAQLNELMPKKLETCPECGYKNGGHKDGCYIGIQWMLLKQRIDQYYDANTPKQKEVALSNVKIYAKNIENLTKQYDKISTKLKDHKPMDENNNVTVAHPEIPVLDKYPTTVPQINLPVTEKITNGNFVMLNKEFDKKLTFRIPGAVTAYGKTELDGTQTWNIFFIKSEEEQNNIRVFKYSQLDTIEHANQHYFYGRSLFNPYEYKIFDPFGRFIVKSIYPIETTLRNVITNNGYEKRLLLIVRNQNKYSVFDPVLEQTVVPEYDNIEKNALGISQNFPRFKILQNNFYGIAEIGNNSLIVPNQYTFIKEYYTANEKFPYYIVSKVANKYGAYNYNGQLVIPLNFSLSEVEKKIASKKFK